MLAAAAAAATPAAAVVLVVVLVVVVVVVVAVVVVWSEGMRVEEQGLQSKPVHQAKARTPYNHLSQSVK